MNSLQILTNLIIGGLAVLVSAYILPGVKVDGFLTALVVSILLSIVNTFIKPLVFFLTLPINILTLGLFSLVINALMVKLVTIFVPGFQVDGLFWAFIFGLVISVVSGAIYTLVPDKK